mgnify:CR=1 FL=1
MGILGFLYPMDTHSISGGMRSLTKALEKSIAASLVELAVSELKTQVAQMDQG